MDKTTYTYHLNSDHELTSLLFDHDHRAYVELYNRYQGLLYIYACKITQDEVEAEDIVQEVFIYLWEKRAEIKIKSSIASFLYSAVRFKFFNLLDSKKVRSDYTKSFQTFIDQGLCTTDHYVREKELANLIEKEISELPPKMREIFELSRKAHLTHKEISARLNISEKTVKNQINNSLKILRSKLGIFGFLYYILFH